MAINYSNWRDEYKSKLSTFEEAANSFKDGDSLAVGTGACNPSAPFFEALFDRIITGDLKDFTLQEGVTVKPHKYHHPKFVQEWYGKMRWLTSYFTPVNLPLGKIGAIDYLPMSGSDGWWRTSRLVNTIYIAVTPPNDYGFVSTGLSSFATPDIILEWKKLGKPYRIIAEVNENMPWVLGDTMQHISEFDSFIEYTSPLVQKLRDEPTEKEAIMGKYVAELINNGDTIQMGWGGVSEAILTNLDGVYDLGVVSEVVPAGLPQLCEKGIITNKYKPHYQGITIAGTCIGNQELYDFMNMNPTALLTRCKQTNDIAFIASHPNFKSINQTAMIDLSGNSTAEGNGHLEFSGCGGQLDFCTGAHYSEGGASINVMPSTRQTKEGALLSNIVPELPLGTPITVPRTMHDYIVTEYGAADLRLLGRQERAKALISIAHPDFRGELRKAMVKNYFPGWYEDKE